MTIAMRMSYHACESLIFFRLIFRPFLTNSPGPPVLFRRDYSARLGQFML